MTRPKKRPLTKDEKLAKDRLRKKEKYEIIKTNPELYAIQKEKERTRYLLRKEKKQICSIKEMTPRSQREQRKRWRENSTKYLQKKQELQRIERIMVENSPPPTESEEMNVEHMIEEKIEDGKVEELDPLQDKPFEKSIRRSDAKLVMRRMRYRHSKTVKRLKAEIKRLKKVIKELKTKCEDQNAEKKGCDTVEKRVDGLLQDVDGDRVKEIKKKLLFEEYVSKNLKEEYDALDKKNKRPFADKILKNRDKLKKHKILSKLPFAQRTRVQKSKTHNVLPDKIRCFLEDDANSSQAAGKKEFVKSNGIKKQKRYLRDNLGNLHEKFCKYEFKVGYSTFCRYRPSWIVAPNTRETCGCKLHTNVNLLMESLKQAKITNEGTHNGLLKSICCNRTDENCLNRTCPQCKNKILEYKEFSNDSKIRYHQWTLDNHTYKGRDGKERTTKVTTKKKLEDYPRNIILYLEAILPKFLTHEKNMNMQYISINTLKQNLKHDEVIIHIDFSENYSLKYNSEIQSFHFGGSRGQVSLHTVVLYYINIQTGLITTQSFCSISKCTQHDAAAIWAHLEPVLDLTKEHVPAVRAIHFLSDSPTSQYRNKYIFYMITKLHEKITSIDTITWNYGEAGHGKGAPDGIGAAVKRAADDFVKYGGDVGSFDDFVKVVTENTEKVKIEVVQEQQILKTKFPNNIPSFKGTMNVHQVIWCCSRPNTVALRKLSCFICRNSYVPCFHERHLGSLNFGVDSETCHPNQDNHERSGPPNTSTSNILWSQHAVDNDKKNHTAIEDSAGVINYTISDFELPTYEDSSYLIIDSPTIQNNITNIDDSGLLNEIDDQAFLRDSNNSSPLLNNKKVTDITKSQVKILSNVPFDWQRYNFYNKKSRAFYQHDQEEYKKFICTTSNEPEKETDKRIIIDIDSTGHVADENVGQYTSNEDLVQATNDSNLKQKDEAAMRDDNKENINQYRSQDYNIGDWVIVQYQIKLKLYAYIGKIAEYSNGTCTVIFLKKSSSSNLFSWPTIEDEDSNIAESRILCVLSKPEINRRGQHSFQNLPDLNYR